MPPNEIQMPSTDSEALPEKPIDKMNVAQIAKELTKRMRELECHPKNCPQANAVRKFFRSPYAMVTTPHIIIH
jgi:hypothetical protein